MMKELKNGVYTYNGEDYSFDFYTNLTTSKKLKLVNSVVSLVVDDTYYNSIIRNLVFDFYVIDIFTNVDTTELKDSINFLDDVEDFLLKTNIVDIVKANAFPTLFDELNDAVDKSIEYKTGIHVNPLNEALSSLINTLEKKIKEVDLNSVTEMVNVFSNMTGDITPESIVKAYMDSGIYKNNKNTKKPRKTKTKVAEVVSEVINDGK